MAKLTQTELKVLANEIQNRVSDILKEKENAIKNSEDYINFEEEFNSSKEGLEFDTLVKRLMSLELSMTRKEYYKNTNSRYSISSKISKNLEQTRLDYIDFLKNKSFPMPKIELGDTQMNSWRVSSMSPYDYALHQLNLKQITSNSDLSAIIDELIKEISNKIK